MLATLSVVDAFTLSLYVIVKLCWSADVVVSPLGENLPSSVLVNSTASPVYSFNSLAPATVVDKLFPTVPRNLALSSKL